MQGMSRFLIADATKKTRRTRVASGEIKINVDINEAERIVIGSRVYDALDSRKHNSIFGYNGKEDVITIKKQDILELIKLVNPELNGVIRIED